QLARTHTIPHVSSGKRSRTRRVALGAHVERFDERLRLPIDRTLVDPSMPPERTLSDSLQHEVETDGQRRHHSFAQSVVGDIAEAELLAGRDVEALHRRAVPPHFARACG